MCRYLLHVRIEVTRKLYQYGAFLLGYGHSLLLFYPSTVYFPTFFDLGVEEIRPTSIASDSSGLRGGPLRATLLSACIAKRYSFPVSWAMYHHASYVDAKIEEHQYSVLRCPSFDSTFLPFRKLKVGHHRVSKDHERSFLPYHDS